MPRPTSSSAKKPASARLATRATLVHGINSCDVIAPPQLGQLRRVACNRVASYDVAQFGQTIAVSLRMSFIPDGLDYVANPAQRDAIDYAAYALERPAS